jgi:hypothetical protein
MGTRHIGRSERPQALPGRGIPRNAADRSTISSRPDADAPDLWHACRMSDKLPSFGLPSLAMFRRPNHDQRDGQRETPRHRQTGLACNLGEVLDLSTSGMRVRCRHTLDGRIDIVLTDYTRQGQLTADVAWMKPVGNFHYEVGLKFRKLTRAMSSRLGSIAMAHRFRRAI